MDVATTLPSLSRPLTPHELRVVAAQAGVDPRTVRRYLAGTSVTSTCAGRIKEVLRAFRVT